MNWKAFEPLATTVLHEGHVLYPYRPSALKNQHRWNFGTLYPPGTEGEPSELHLEILIECAEFPMAAVRVVFLDGDTIVQTESSDFLETHLAALAPDLWRLTATARNPGREPMLSAQLRCALDRGQFISAQDPPPAFADAAAACQSRGVYPVLVGVPGARDLVLAAPIILADWAGIAPQSTGNFCDSTEMDELLTLRVMTLSAAEKAEIRAAGGTAAAILDRCEPGPPPELHGGAVAPWDPFAQPPQSVFCNGRQLRAGDRVRLHPRPGADLFSSLLAGKLAHIQAIEQDLEGAVHLAVVAEDDPGADLGDARQSGHRFFFSLSEVEPL
ncbi:MAG: hypothetical protein EPN33_03265 [Acidobacteria bacterium]|nr:MAG: hypothetical protein EPN33_03265 [Acidobacteriota bacterium]